MTEKDYFGGGSLFSPDLSGLGMYGAVAREQPEGHHRHSGKEATMNPLESVPTTWDDARDGQFFRIVSHVLDARFLEAASSLLGANDPELAPAA